MWIVLTAASSLLLGWELCARVWRGDDLRSCERAAFAAIVASALWLGTAWLLALVHWLTRPMLIARTLLFALAAIVVLLRRARIERWRERLDQQVDATTLKRWLLPLVPVVLWVFFVAWRGLLLPPLSHDALSYHMPKALFFARAAGYTDLADVRFLVTARPSNYELLLAESIVMSGNDDTTEWISVLMYLGFIIAAAAMAQRWSDGDRASTMIVALLTAASPVVLLHSGAHKNDVMTAFFVVAGLVAAGRWFATRERASLVICAAAFALGIGTKAHAFLVPLFLLPFIAWHARRELKRLAVPALAAIVFFFALGAWEEPAAVLKHAETPATASAGQKTPGYGAWRNVWRGAYVLLAAPFSTDSYELSVPWSKGTWYWRRYEIYFSELGVAFSLGIVALAFTRKWRSEMTPIVIATFASVLVILPVHRLPDGFYVVNLPRLVMHLMPVVFSATVPALVARLGARTIDLALAAASLYFCFYATNVAFNDNFAPLDFTLWARQHPGTRVVYFDPFRATEICDRTAGPRDVIAIDAGPSAWIYPAYGAALQRRVELIPPGKGAPVIPRDAQWVIIDRSWNRFWGDPNFSDLSDWRHRLGGGLPSAEDTRVIRAVVASGQFKAVFFDRARLQAVFRRKP